MTMTIGRGTPPEHYDEGGHQGYYRGQSADLKPHLTYFDPRTQASYVWDGEGDMIAVSLGGYGEPVDHEIPAPARVNGEATFFEVLMEFEAICQTAAMNLPTY